MEFGGRKNKVMAFGYLIFAVGGAVVDDDGDFSFLSLEATRSSCFNHTVRRSDVVHAFLLASYAVGMVLML